MGESAKPLISVAILTWNRRQHVAKAIDSVWSQTYRPVEVVVVDSASTDGTGEFIPTNYPDVKYIRLHRNLGCPEGRNVALANCSGDIIYALDDDGWLAPDTLQVCVDRFNEFPRLGVVGCDILAPDEVQTTFKPDTWHHVFSGGACAMRREVLVRAGFYPSDFYRQAEEADLVLRVIEQGYEILHCPRAVMYHERSSINRNDKLFLYYSVRNELYTVIRRYPWRYIFPAALQKAVTWNYLGVRCLAFHYTVAGVAAALFRIPRLLQERRPVSTSVIKKVWSMKIKDRYRGTGIGMIPVRNGTGTRQ